MTVLKSWGLFDEYIEANKDGTTTPLTVQDVEAVMNRIIDARVEQKLAQQKATPKNEAPDDKKGS